jgi:hypothetical protein
MVTIVVGTTITVGGKYEYTVEYLVDQYVVYLVDVRVVIP